MKKLITIIIFGYFLSGCDQIESLPTEVPYVEGLDIDNLIFKKFDPSKSSRILDLDESQDIVVDYSKRRFQVDKLIQLTKLDSLTLQITSYVPQTIIDVNLYFYLEEIDEYILISHLDSLPRFAQLTFTPNLLKKKSSYKTESGRYVEIYIPSSTEIIQNYKFESSDPHWKVLKTIKAKWDVSFNHFDRESWRLMNALYAREWILIAINLAYMLSSPEYEIVMNNFETIFNDRLYDNNNNYFTKEKYKEEIVRFLEYDNLRCGIVLKTGGLGGYGVWGIANWNFYGHYVSFSGWHTIAHEFGHNKGYGHTSNLANNNVENSEGIITNWPHLMSDLHAHLRYTNKIPYPDRNLLGLHLPENDQYRYKGVDPAKLDDARSEREYKTNRIRLYFEKNPLK